MSQIMLASAQSSNYSAMIGYLRTRVRKQPIIAIYFEFETVLKFYNLWASWLWRVPELLQIQKHWVWDSQRSLSWYVQCYVFLSL